MKLSKKYLFNILLVVGVTAAAMYFALKDNFKEIVDAIARMNPITLFLVLCWGVLIVAVCGVGYQVLGRLFREDYSLKEGLIVSFVGNFFAGITPSSTGGQFGQIYVLKKQGIGYAQGASLLWADFIIYQTTMMIYVTILFVLRFTHYVNLSGWFWFVFAGYLVNLGVIITLYTLALFPKVYIRLSGKAASLLAKLHIIKNPEKTSAKWQEKVTGFTANVGMLSRNKSVMIKCGLVNMIRLSLYYSLPYVIAKGLGIDLAYGVLVDTMALASFVTMANSFVPLPGASGGTEVFFTLMFKHMLKDLTGAVMLLWRFSSYYIPVIAGAVVFLIFKGKKDREDDIHEAGTMEKGTLQHGSVMSDIPSADDPDVVIDHVPSDISARPKIQ